MNEQYPLPEYWQPYWEKVGYEQPSAIQKVLYQPLIEGKSVIGVSPTGSGKTVAYLLPLLAKIRKGEGNQLLILLPSQELAIQVATVAKEWATQRSISVQSVIGGANKKRQIEKLREKPEVIVGTPGRVMELIREKKIKAHLIQMLVLDEVDQLLQSSELNATNHILKAITRDVQIVCVSATGTRVEDTLKDTGNQTFQTFDVTDEDTSSGSVVHGFIEVPLRKRGETLRRLGHIPGMKAIIFFNQLQDMGAMAEKLQYEGIAVATLASDQNKMERRLALHGFEEGKLTFLLTTDVAARGLDFEKLPVVVHYDIPYTLDSYVHRSGRTGRMGEQGTVLTLVNESNQSELKRLLRGTVYQLTELFVYGGKLQENNPQKNEEERHTHQQMSSPKKKSKKGTTKNKK